MTHSFFCVSGMQLQEIPWQRKGSVELILVSIQDEKNCRKKKQEDSPPSDYDSQHSANPKVEVKCAKEFITHPYLQQGADTKHHLRLTYQTSEDENFPQRVSYFVLICKWKIC